MNEYRALGMLRCAVSKINIPHLFVQIRQSRVLAVKVGVYTETSTLFKSLKKIKIQSAGWMNFPVYFVFIVIRISNDKDLCVNYIKQRLNGTIRALWQNTII